MNFDAFDHQCMAEALRLAERGLFSTHPNPRVGCVLARDGHVVGTGWHRAAGEAHAEIWALEQAGDSARGATAYVTLEPCSHHGRTPPCAQALIEAGVATVVMAMPDPNPEVNGGGLHALEQAGVACRNGLMADQAKALNCGFVSRMRRGRPWLRVKLAISLDGRTALRNGASQWITGAPARADVQRWRARSSALMTGIETLLADDPSLNVRLDGVEHQPLRVVVDSRWRTPVSARTMGLPGEVVIAGCRDQPVPAALENSSATLLKLGSGQGRIDLGKLMSALSAMEINEIQVEAGPTLCGALLQARLVDEVLLYQAPSLLGDEARAPFAFGPLEAMSDRFSLNWHDRRQLGPDLRLRLWPQYLED